jgi:DNA invertase Pin-like site-specific DNA recombinase
MAIKQRQAEGIKIAMQKGIKFGRPKANLPQNHLEIFAGYLSKDINSKTAMELLEISRGTFFKLVKIYRNIIVC